MLTRSARSPAYAERVTLRCTARLLKALRVAPKDLAELPASDDDWYANLFWIDRRKCLLLTHAATAFPVLALDVRVPALRDTGSFIVPLIAAALADEALAPDALGPLDPANIQIAKTASRRVLGFMNDTAFMIQIAIDNAGGIEHADASDLNHKLRRHLHRYPSGYAQPIQLATDRATSLITTSTRIDTVTDQ